MKHKPMLLNKIMEAGHGRGREVIGLIGTRHGTGVTHTGLMLALFLGEEFGRKTAFLECNHHHDMRLIGHAYEWSREEDDFFRFHQVTCYPEVNLSRISEIYGENYQSLVLDFGTDFAGNKEEFLRCSTKIVICGQSEWDIPKLNGFVEASEAIRGNDSWLYFIPRGDKKHVIKISNEIGRKVYAVPETLEPTIPTHISNRFFERFF